jgi:phosphonate transport system substrate-binding protein
VFFAVAVLLLSPALHAQEEGDSYALAIVPQYSPLDVHQAWSPVLDHIRSKWGISIHLVTYDGFSGFIDGLKKGRPDLAYMAPYHLVIARREQGYVPLLRSNKQPLIGILVVPQNSAIRDIHSLAGAHIAFPSPNAFAASLYLRAHLDANGIKYQPAYVKNHSNVYRLVAQHNTRGGVEAGGGVNLSFAKQPDDIRQQLRVIYETPPLVAHPVCSHPRVPEKDRQIITRAILELAETADGRSMLEAIQLSMPVVTTYEEEYLPIEKLQLERLMEVD